MFKCALIYGMTSEEFWFGNPQDYFVYQDAFAEREKKRYKDYDILSWQIGNYCCSAFRQVYSEAWGKKTNKKKFFPEKPISLKENKNDDMLAKFMKIADKVNRRFNNAR